MCPTASQSAITTIPFLCLVAEETKRPSLAVKPGDEVLGYEMMTRRTPCRVLGSRRSIQTPRRSQALGSGLSRLKRRPRACQHGCCKEQGRQSKGLRVSAESSASPFRDER